MPCSVIPGRATSGNCETPSSEPQFLLLASSSSCTICHHRLRVLDRQPNRHAADHLGSDGNRANPARSQLGRYDRGSCCPTRHRPKHAVSKEEEVWYAKGARRETVAYKGTSTRCVIPKFFGLSPFGRRENPVARIVWTHAASGLQATLSRILHGRPCELRHGRRLAYLIAAATSWQASGYVAHA